MSIIEALKWRSAIKKFDPTKTVSNEDVEQLIEAGNLTATSGGLQPFKIIVVQNQAIQDQLVPASYGQHQVADASHVLVFAIETPIDEGIVDRYIQRASEVRNQDVKSLEGYSTSMKGYISTMDDSTKQAWAKSQSFIAMGSVLAMAAELKVDSCPMEGIVPQQYIEILGLSSENLLPVAALPIGYRSSEDVYSKMDKVRKTRENFVLEIK